METTEEQKLQPENNIEFNPNTAAQYTQKYLKDNPIAPDDTYVSRLSSVYPAPKPYTPQQEENTRNSASMAETLKSLAEIYGQSKGAYLQKRQPEESAKAENRILYDKNKYDTDLREYGRAMVGAMGQDSERLQQLRHNAQQYGQTMANNELAIAKAKYERQNHIADKQDDRNFQTSQTKEKLSHDSNENALNRKNAVNIANLKKQDDTTVIPVPAHPNDPNGVANPITGQRMANIPIVKKDIDAYYTRAMNDPQFFVNHPTLRSGDGRRVPFKDADKSAIAITQAQDEYNKQFATKTTVPPPPTATWKFPVLQKEEQQGKGKQGHTLNGVQGR